MNSPVITPTVGRKVWFRLNGIPQLARAGVEQYTPAAPSNNGVQPFDATVVYVWGDRLVNLLVLDHYGNPFTATSVPLLQPGDVAPSAGFYAEWMPYQQGQARKDAASEVPAAAITLPVVDPGPDALEREIQAKADKAPRVTPDALKAEIVSAWYINGATGVVPNELQPPVPADSPLNLLTICVLVLRNGFTVHGVSACASPENFNEEIGRRIARENAEREIWPLLGFRLRDQLAHAKTVEAT